MNKKVTFLYGLGEKSEYKPLFKYFRIPKIDWNKSTIKPEIGKVDTLIGFSMGAVLACEHAVDSKVKTLILCSMTTGVETIDDVKADRIIFIIGEKEKWVIKDTKRLVKDLKCDYEIIIVPKADHWIMGNYKRKLLETVNNLAN